MSSLHEQAIQRLKDSLSAHLHGKLEAIDSIITCLLAEGHILIEDIPGVGKTTLAYLLAKSVDCEFNRIQFTSDILPSDILGVSIYQGTENSFNFFEGPIFSNIILADEINRASPRSQSALLEAMERGIVSVDGEARPIDTPFMVIATQNPVDFESTFPLPNAQLDRFLMRIAMGYPSEEDEATLLRSGKTHYDRMAIRPVISKTEIQELQVKAQSVFIDDSIYNYIHEIILATRVRPNIELGVSPRGALAFRSALQAAALVNGRNFVSPDDVQQYAVPCLAHRLRLASKVAGTYDWDASARVVSEILSELPAPHYRRS
ncbi:MAG: MoxR-like ATPase [Candidatus Pelagisphaera sp.]|jgi:MoxR-like ATPase